MTETTKKKIFQPLKLNNMTLKNRLLRSATWEGIAALDGSIDERTYSIYEELAKGGVGGIITGFTSVSDNDTYFEGMMRLSNDKLIPQYKKLTDIAHKENCPIIAQLALGAYYKNDREIRPNQMTEEDIKNTIDLFIKAAEREKQANYDGVQIHAAHFFFLSRFISPLINERNENGSIDNRIRILIEILKGIKSKNLGLHVSLKINSSDFEMGELMKKNVWKYAKKWQKKELTQLKLVGMGLREVE